LWTDAIADEIVERIATGEPMAVICRDPDMPSDRVVREWQQNRPDFSAAIARARDIGADVMAWTSKRVAWGEEGYSTGDVQRDRLICHHTLQLLAKWNPKKYAERHLTEITGADGGAVQFESRQALDFSGMDPDERELIRDLLERARADAALDVTPRGDE
jgi:hypothetical protein